MERVTYLALPAVQAPSAADQTRPARRLPPPSVRLQMQELPTVTSVADAVSLEPLAANVPVGRIGGLAGSGRSGVAGFSGPFAGGAGVGRGGNEVFPPQARYSILPPLPRPASVRGKTFRVHFWVDAQGKVTRVDVNPPIPDGEYRKQFVQLMYQYTFAPALRPDGTPVAGETVLTITL
jgi:hypothetical protein